MVKEVLKYLYNKIFIFYLSLFKKCKFGRNCSVSYDSKFEEKNYIGSNSKFIHSSIGYGSYVSDSADICYTKIGKFSSIGKNFITSVGSHPIHKFVSTHPAFYSIKHILPFPFVKEQRYEEYSFIEKNVSISIGNDVWIGNNVVIVVGRGGVKIGNGSVIGAGAVVTHDIPEYAVAVGAPAAVIKYRFTTEDIIFLKQLNWWDKNEKWFFKYAEYFNDIDTLKEKLYEV